MRHTFIEYSGGHSWGYVNDPGDARDPLTRELMLELARPCRIPGAISVWYHPASPPDTGAAVTIGHNHNLDHDMVTLIRTGVWDDCWPVFEAYVHLL